MKYLLGYAYFLAVVLVAALRALLWLIWNLDFRSVKSDFQDTIHFFYYRMWSHDEPEGDTVDDWWFAMP